MIESTRGNVEQQLARGNDEALRQAERRREARHSLRRIARDHGVQWLLREAQVIAVWSPDPTN
jgi:hypothetical protein